MKARLLTCVLLLTAAVGAGLSGAGAAFVDGRRIEPSKIDAALT